MLLAPAYGLTVAADYLVFNFTRVRLVATHSIRFSAHLWYKDWYVPRHQPSVDPSLTEAPVGPITSTDVIKKGQMQQIGWKPSIQMDINTNLGERAIESVFAMARWWRTSSMVKLCVKINIKPESWRITRAIRFKATKRWKTVPRAICFICRINGV